MKILMFVNGLYPETIGGIEKIGSDLAARLSARHEVVVFTKYKKDLPVVEERNGFLVRRFKGADDYRFRMSLGIRTVNLIKEVAHLSPRPDVVLSMSLGFGFVGYLCKKFFGLPYLVYVLGTDWYIARDSFIPGAAFKFSIRKCNCLLTQTNIMRDEIRKFFPGVNMRVVPNGIELHDKRAGGDKIVFLGRLDRVKGVEYLVEALRGMNRSVPALIAGGGPEERRIRELSRGLDVEMPGRVVDTESVFMQGKVFVLPSLSEGLPQAILEAMSYGLPVVATRVGGVPDVIEHGETGFLVEPGNADELRKHIEILVEDDELRSRMSERCLARVQRYSWDRVAGELEEIMAESIDG